MWKLFQGAAILNEKAFLFDVIFRTKIVLKDDTIIKVKQSYFSDI